ncbi:PIF1-like helicase-domain-containing protein [Mycena vulgaris]|nr:PIF1-like helicase-domain-containing protein [Mycena vulgaris]
MTAKQQEAHDIIERHLRLTLAGTVTPRLLLIIRGASGTGKSALVRAIRSTFANLSASSMLASIAPTGIAASIIDGRTIHSWAKLPTSNARSFARESASAKSARTSNVHGVRYILVDHCSSLSQRQLALLSSVLDVESADDSAVGDDFGGRSVILLGDLAQFPPSSNPRDALYSGSRHNALAATGERIHRRFGHVVTLAPNVRVLDPSWSAVLERVRAGICSTSDLSFLDTLTLTSPGVSLTEGPWEAATLITPCRALARAWNAAALRRWCEDSGAILYLCPSFDSTARCTDLPLTEDVLDELETTHTFAGGLASVIEIAIGSRVFAKVGGTTVLGEIISITLDERDITPHPPRHVRSVYLRFPPTSVLFKPCHGVLPHSEASTAIVSIACTTFSFAWNRDGAHPIKISRTQLPLQSAYAVLDYKSEGFTFPFVIADVATPPRVRVSRWSAYAALSASRSRSTIRILRAFDHAVFTTPFTEGLQVHEHAMDGFNSGPSPTLDTY